MTCMCLTWCRTVFHANGKVSSSSYDMHVFDLVSTSASVVSAVEADVPAFHSLRALRVLRVIRLVGKAGSLKAIVEALLVSIVPVLNSIMLLGLVTCIFAVIGVGLFADQDPILFGTFSQSFFTMFQSCTGDGWASGVARTMFHENGKVSSSSYDYSSFCTCSSAT